MGGYVHVFPNLLIILPLVLHILLCCERCVLATLKTIYITHKLLRGSCMILSQLCVVCIMLGLFRVPTDMDFLWVTVYLS